MEWEALAVSLVSGLVGAVLACTINFVLNLVIQDKREKRNALREYFQRRRRIKRAPGVKPGLRSNVELLNEMYMSFSNSRKVRRCLKEHRGSTQEARNINSTRKALVNAICKSAWVKFDEFLYGNDIRRN